LYTPSCRVCPTVATDTTVHNLHVLAGERGGERDNVLVLDGQEECHKEEEEEEADAHRRWRT
jgi:hypothetical protein